MNFAMLWNLTLRCLVEVCQYFGGMYCLQPKGSYVAYSC